ncbi:ABC transporter permease [candidate division KSB1 bacterium]|nr:ABC transporter permease [candidate division KSB1 bacterium]
MNPVLPTIIKKEFIHIWRDPQTLVIILLMPLMMLILYGYAITLEMKQIRTAVVDLDKTPQSREFIEKIISTGFFHVTRVDVPYRQIEDIFFRSQARCVIVIPDNFAEKLAGDSSTPVQLVVDASDPNAANFINNYMARINVGFNLQHGAGNGGIFSVEARLLYNPDLLSAYFFVPGLVAVIILLSSALLTSIAIVREIEFGTMEQILVSPVRPNQIIIGKIVPYLVLSFLDGVLILFFAHLWFHVPVYGSLLLLGFSLFVYILTGLCFGVLISTVARSQQVAMMAVMVITILPSFMLSGFIFPVRSMPHILREISVIVPATHFLRIIRGIMLKGTGIFQLLPELGILTAFSILLIAISIRKFHTKLE